MKLLILILLLLYAVPTAFTAPPEPPMGMRWVLNPEMSDEFNGTQLDKNKWLDYHPTWTGRVPGIFLPSQISVADGYMQIRGEKLEEDIIVTNWRGEEFAYNIACGAVVSRKTTFLGYYECRLKAAGTTMSTTFWFSNDTAVGPNGCDKYSLEWDIQECIGRTGNFQGSWFANGMHSNSHYWYTDCGGTKHDYRSHPEIRFSESELASENFHVYGGWWQDATKASYYYDNGEPKTHNFYHEITDTPFDRPMRMRLVSETYPFPWIELPNDAELADPSKNVAYYDWVRGYSLVHANEPFVLDTNPNLVTNGGFEFGNENDWGGWGGTRSLTSTPEHVHSGEYAYHVVGNGALTRQFLAKPNTEYILTFYSKVTPGSIVDLTVRDGAEGMVSCTEKEYTKKAVTFTTGDDGVFSISYWARNGSSQGYVDDFELVETTTREPEPAPVVEIYNENVLLATGAEFLASPGELKIPCSYQANEDREIELQVFDDTGNEISATRLHAYAGYGRRVLDFPVGGELDAGTGYKLVARILPVGGDEAESIHSDTLYFNLSTVGLMLKSGAILNNFLHVIIPASQVQDDANYILEHSENMEEGSWQEIAQHSTASPVLEDHQFLLGAEHSDGFFRVRVELGSVE